MPDEAKFQKLREMGYTVPVSCGLCRHGLFADRRSGWGECALHRYVHGKHDSPPEGRGVSIHASGTCPRAEPSSEQVRQLGAFAQFVETS
jgi:hypothetical protein